MSSASSPWDELSALLPVPTTLPPAAADPAPQLPSNFISVLHAHLESHSSKVTSPIRSTTASVVSGAAEAVNELLPHFRHLLSSPTLLRDALSGSAAEETLCVTDAAAKNALVEILPKMTDFASLGAQESATWLAGVHIGENVVDAGAESAKQAHDSVRDVFEKIQGAREKLERDLDKERDTGA